jgi:flagellar biogenesis protein FliO
MSTALFLLDVSSPAARLGASAGPDLTRYFTVLGILLLAILGLAFGFKKLFATTLRTKAARRQLSIVDVLPLGGKQRLAVVRCYDRTFALGLGEKEVSLIAEIDPVNTEGRAQSAPGVVERTDFKRVLDEARANPDVVREAVAPAPGSRVSVGQRVRQLLGANGVLG